MKIIKFRQVERNAICACCTKEIKRHDERVISFFKGTSPGGTVNICSDCIGTMKQMTETDETKHFGLWPSDITAFELGKCTSNGEPNGEILKIWTQGGNVFVSEAPEGTTHVQWGGPTLDNSNLQIMTYPYHNMLKTSTFTEMYATLR